MRIDTRCTQNKQIQVLSSGAGFYIGTLEDGMPFCRLSVERFNKEEEANTALEKKTYTVRNCMEGNFCNEGKGCLRRGDK